MMPMHMDFPSDHPVEEVGRHLLAVLLKHQVSIYLSILFIWTFQVSYDGGRRIRVNGGLRGLALRGGVGGHAGQLT